MTFFVRPIIRPQRIFAKINGGGGEVDGVTNPTPFIKFLFIGAPNFIQKVGW